MKIANASPASYIGAHRIPARPARYRCDVCGIEDEWQETWSWLGSILQSDQFPEDLAHVCSEECKAEFQRAIKDGRVQEPKYSKRRIANARTRARRGYGAGFPPLMRKEAV